MDDQILTGANPRADANLMADIAKPDADRRVLDERVWDRVVMAFRMNDDELIARARGLLDSSIRVAYHNGRADKAEEALARAEGSPSIVHLKPITARCVELTPPPKPRGWIGNETESRDMTDAELKKATGAD